MKKKQLDIDEIINQDTGEVIEPTKLNQLIYHETVHPITGHRQVFEDYSNCPSMAEQHTAHLSDINYLIERYKPDELAAYLAVRQTRPAIQGHDFSEEPSLQEANNINLRLKKSFEALDPEITQSFRNHVEFLKFIDNPANQEKMIKLGLMTKTEIKNHTLTNLNDDKTKPSQTNSQPPKQPTP